MYKVYQIQLEDTINDIALKTGVPVRELERLNGLNNNYMLVPGEYLVIPKSEESGDFKVYEIKKGDTIYEIAQRFDTDYEQLLKLNGLNKDDYIYPGEEIDVPRKGVKFYITDDNDTMQDVVKYLETNPVDILSINEKIYLKPDQLIYAKRYNTQ